jgi:ubiquinone/menaquinone biosynthesis C-methylase UbiE
MNKVSPKSILGQFSGGSVLDVATGSGGFIHFLMEGLADYTEIIGIDNNERSAPLFIESFKDIPPIRFKQMDARQMEFPAASFDTVCIANSLHHFADPQVVLHEMNRVLRPGGYFILAEMFHDGQTKTQLTHVYLHHWWATVDRVAGVVHNETFQREDLVGFISRLGLKELAFYDLADTDENPKMPENLAELDSVIDRYIQRAEGHPDLQARGEELRLRVHEIGIHGATSLICIGIKPLFSEVS